MNNQNLFHQRRMFYIAQVFSGVSIATGLLGVAIGLRDFGKSTGVEAVRQMNGAVSSLGIIFLGVALLLGASSSLKGEDGWGWRRNLSMAFLFVSMIIACRSLWLKM